MTPTDAHEPPKQGNRPVRLRTTDPSPEPALSPFGFAQGRLRRRGVSRGFTVRERGQPRQGRQKAADGVSGQFCTRRLTPLSGLSRGGRRIPTAYAVGYILSPYGLWEGVSRGFTVRERGKPREGRQNQDLGARPPFPLPSLRD